MCLLLLVVTIYDDGVPASGTVDLSRLMKGLRARPASREVILKNATGLNCSATGNSDRRIAGLMDIFLIVSSFIDTSLPSSSLLTLSTC
jgi:hypothetical protein